MLVRLAIFLLSYHYKTLNKKHGGGNSGKHKDDTIQMEEVDLHIFCKFITGNCSEHVTDNRGRIYCFRKSFK